MTDPRAPALTAAPRRWPAPPLVQASAGLHALAGAAALAVPEAWPWAAGAVAANHGLLTGLGLWPRSRLLGPNWTRLPEGAARRGAVALTIDDGPDPEVTPRVLDLLDAAGVRATFFCIARRAQAQGPLVRELLRRGHDVQNHSHRHAHTFSLLGPRRLRREIGDAQQALADLSGRWPHCFRAPAGLRSPLLDPALHRLGLNLVSWTRRGFDTRPGPAQAVAERLLCGLRGGNILLLHDGHAGRDAAGQPRVLGALPPLLAALRAQGLRAETLTEALPRRQPGPR